MANTIWVEATEEPDYFIVGFRCKDAHLNPVAGAKGELFTETVITSASQALATSPPSGTDGICKILDVPEGTYGWRVKFASGKVKVGTVIVDAAHAV